MWSTSGRFLQISFSHILKIEMFPNSILTCLAFAKRFPNPKVRQPSTHFSESNISSAKTFLRNISSPSNIVFLTVSTFFSRQISHRGCTQMLFSRQNTGKIHPKMHFTESKPLSIFYPRFPRFSLHNQYTIKSIRSE